MELAADSANLERTLTRIKDLVAWSQLVLISLDLYLPCQGHWTMSSSNANKVKRKEENVREMFTLGTKEHPAEEFPPANRDQLDVSHLSAVNFPQRNPQGVSVEN